MITLGVILLIVGLVAHVGTLWTVGVLLLVLGLVVAILGTTDRLLFGRRHWF